MNQLVRENDAYSGKTYVYEYDSNGNILSKKTYSYTTGSLGSLLSTVNYTYGDESWGDLLTNYNGTNIAYDEIGNPLNWHNVTSMTWEQGRRLTAYSYVKNGKTYNVTLEYNKDGIRTSKTTVNASNPSDFLIETYVVDGSSIIRESIIKSGSMITLYYLYDANGDVIGFNYGNSSTYFYGKNLQGDVVALFDSQSRLVARYYYDAWGNVLSITDANGTEITSQTHIANVNPIRYRSYHFDSDTGFYYLNSRYYDSKVGRFINADVLIAGSSESLMGYNVFVYCFNIPVNTYDSSGKWPQWIKESVKWVAENVVKPVVKTVEDTLSKVDLTYTMGVNVSGTPSVWNFNGQLGFSMDTKGNIAIQTSVSGGITSGSPSVAISSYRCITNAPNIDKLTGDGYQIGGSALIPVEGIKVVAGSDYNIIPDKKNHTTYFGKTYTAGIGAGEAGAEFHVEWGKTKTAEITQINIFDFARKVYDKIMEW